MIKDAARSEGANHFYHGLLAEEAGFEVVYITARWLNSVTAYRVCELWGTVSGTAESTCDSSQSNTPGSFN